MLIKKNKLYAKKTTSNRVKKYELTYLINPELTQEQIVNVEGIVKNHIQTRKGYLDKTSKKPVKRNLGYPIKKKRTAIMSVFNFSLPAVEIEKLKQKLSSEKKILRFILIAKKLVKPKKKDKKRICPLVIKSKSIPISKKISSIKIKTQPKKEKKVDLKEIDEKLEKILKL